MLEGTIMEFVGKKVLIIIENLPAPFDRRVWQEATALRDHGAKVSIICPIGKGYDKKYEVIDDIEIYRHSLPFEAKGALGYILEYSWALMCEFYLTLKCYFKNGFDVIHACNPPDLIFLVAKPFMLLGKKFVFDHHDINPELFLAKFNKKNFLYRLVVLLEKLTFKNADVVISTNESYKKIAMERGNKQQKDIFVVRSGPSFKRLKIRKGNENYKKGRRYLVGYVGVIGKQEGLNYLVDAAKYIVYEKGIKSIQFVCVGGGTELQAIKKYAFDCAVGEYFTFTGRVPDEMLLDVLNTADICVNPDEYNEMNDKSTMNKIMEYMALKKPIVQFDLAEGRFSAREASLYAERNNAVDFAKKIIYLLSNPDLMRKMGEYGHYRVKAELEWEYEKENLYNAYRKVFICNKKSEVEGYIISGINNK